MISMSTLWIGKVVRLVVLKYFWYYFKFNMHVTHTWDSYSMWQLLVDETDRSLINL